MRAKFVRYNDGISLIVDSMDEHDKLLLELFIKQCSTPYRMWLVGDGECGPTRHIQIACEPKEGA